MTWIPVEDSLWADRKTLMLAAELDLSPTYAGAHVIRLWHWAIDNAPDLSLARLPARVIAQAADYPGDPDVFLQSLLGSGFLEEDGAIHDRDERFARLLDARRRERERKASERSAARAEVSTPPPDVRRTAAGRPLPKEVEVEERGESEERERRDTARKAVVVDFARASAPRNHALHHLSPADKVKLETLLDLFPACRQDPAEQLVLAHLIRLYPPVAWTYEAGRCKAHYKRAPASWAIALSNWITEARAVLCVDGKRYPPDECTWELAPEEDPYNPDRASAPDITTEECAP
jgi:hypothetical protein